MAPLDGNDGDDDDDDIDAYINTGAYNQDMYMPPMDEEAFRTHGDQLGRPTTVTQRLTFTGLSLKTLLRRLAIQLKSNRLPFSALTRCIRRSSGSHPNQPQHPKQHQHPKQPSTQKAPPSAPQHPKHPQQHSIQYLEGILLKDKDPNYPVFTVKVPADPNFVQEDPADIFFIAFEDVFNLFHWKRLDYNLLQDGSSTRTKAVRYLESFMLMNNEKNTILLPVFPEDKYCTLVILCPKWSLAQYFDSSNTTTKKDYKRIRGVLDEAILGYSKNGGTFDKKGEFIRPDTKKLRFKHVIDFPCIKQPADNMKEAFYVLHHLKGFVADAEIMSLPPKMTYYVVFEGRVPEVYEEWEDCKKHVHKFNGNCYKGYPTRHEAIAKWRKYQSNKSKMKTFIVLSLLLTIVAAVLYFILV
ncbi:hypothetical protein QYE76_024722 [Lolium multiflorum]|uniref:Ribonuclease H1 N-terminal domain-containing protein n=1 Tax=Lolium multiflorum TaxID=4521 RepID=A0AAD8VVY6_LOLMU|nr:hypothetical protein QYE76_024722 [Lolium multiflorum]